MQQEYFLFFASNLGSALLPTKSRKRLVSVVMFTAATNTGRGHDVTGVVNMIKGSVYIEDVASFLFFLFLFFRFESTHQGVN